MTIGFYCAPLPRNTMIVMFGEVAVRRIERTRLKRSRPVERGEASWSAGRRWVEKRVRAHWLR